MRAERLIARLRSLRRGYKFAILLVAAWAPFLLPNHPLMTWALMALMTSLFFVATAQKSAIATTEFLAVHEKTDVES
jgi:hypothetical protein